MQTAFGCTKAVLLLLAGRKRLWALGHATLGKDIRLIRIVERRNAGWSYFRRNVSWLS